MAKFSDLTVDIKLTPTDETVERALKILEWYCNDTGKAVLTKIVERDDGTGLELRFVDNYVDVVNKYCDIRTQNVSSEDLIQAAIDEVKRYAK